MDQRQIQIVGAQFFQAHLKARDQLARAKLAGPHLGGQVDLVTGNSAAGQHVADLGFVVIDLGGIDMAIAQLQTVGQGGKQRLALQAKGAQTHGWHIDHLVPQWGGGWPLMG